MDFRPLIGYLSGMVSTCVEKFFGGKSVHIYPIVGYIVKGIPKGSPGVGYIRPTVMASN